MQLLYSVVAALACVVAQWYTSNEINEFIHNNS